MTLKDIIIKGDPDHDEAWEETNLWFRIPITYVFPDCKAKVKSVTSVSIVGDCLKIECIVNESFLRKLETDGLTLHSGTWNPLEDCDKK